ncbi:MAG TPA: MBL fold metallo-hydrolase [candidate division Zixibacteria bacterium]|nr:MBL fold metallo-hydrolase [candidate division Zixibacteria bacterium]
MPGEEIFFEQIRSAGCLSYLLGCKAERACVLIDPELSKAEDYVGLARFFDASILYAIDTHTHADHNSACKVLRERHGIPVVMHRLAEAPYVDLRVDDGDEIRFGRQALTVLYTPGHTPDAVCLLFRDRIFTGDTLLIGGCGRTDLPGGDAEQQFDSLRRLEALADDVRVYPGHDYREAVSTLGEEKRQNPRLRVASRDEFVRVMTARRPPLPRKIAQALEWNRTPIQGTQRGSGEGI